MANRRTMACGKQILAIGQEGSQRDIEEREKTCAQCDKEIFCSIRLKK